jgi:hypothetical protein
VRQISRRLAATAAVTALAVTGVGYALASPPAEQVSSESAPGPASPADKQAGPTDKPADKQASPADKPAGPTVHEVTAAELGETWRPGMPGGPGGTASGRPRLRGNRR